MNCVIIGSGNVASHFAKAFFEKGHTIRQVYSRDRQNAFKLASPYLAEDINSLQEIVHTADLYFIAVTDNAIEEVISNLSKKIKGKVVHCSGATPLSILSKFQSFGVIYPAQSLSKEVSIDFSSLPFAIEGNNLKTESELLDMMNEISDNVFKCDTRQRLALHTSAVFANNFSNYLYSIAQQILEDSNLSFDLIRPIILETANKVKSHFPNQVQTGPAIRNDQTTINKHLEFLKDHPDWSEIYQLLTKGISNQIDNS